MAPKHSTPSPFFQSVLWSRPSSTAPRLAVGFSTKSSFVSYLPPPLPIAFSPVLPSPGIIVDRVRNSDLTPSGLLHAPPSPPVLSTSLDGLGRALPPFRPSLGSATLTPQPVKGWVRPKASHCRGNSPFLFPVRSVLQASSSFVMLTCDRLLHADFCAGSSGRFPSYP